MENAAKKEQRRGARAGIPLWAGLLVGAIGSACAAPMSVRAAESGDFVGLKVAIAQERAGGKLDPKRVADLAKVVGDREIRRATGPDALLRIEEARACWRPLAGSLEDRAKQSDDPGAWATLALLDGRPSRLGAGATLLEKHGASPNPLWRAVAARGAVGTRFGAARRKFFLDPDERVRLAALRAALELPDPADAAALVEVARLDPNPVAQAIATRAAGEVASADVVMSLRDRYATADEGLRQSIVDAWGRPALSKAGGRRELIAVAENQTGAYAVEAGALLAETTGDAEARAIGQRTLLRAIGQGLSRDRRLAIGRAPTNERDILEALRTAAHDADVPVKIAALTRLGQIAQERTKAWADLRKLSEEGSRDALHALARAGDPTAVARVEKELSSTDAEARLAAMNALVAAGRFANAADLLADVNPSVRMRTSCAVLSVRSP